MKKKTFKKAGVAVLTMAMLLSMGAVAATSVSAYTFTPTTLASTTINVEGAKGTYTIYQVAAGQKNNATGAISYEVNAGFTGILSVSGGYVKYGTKNLTDITGHSADAEALALALTAQTNAATGAPAALDTENAASGTATFDVPAIGYYLITGKTSGSTQPILVHVTEAGSTSVELKFSDVEIEKEIIAIDTVHGTDGEIGEVAGGQSAGIADAGATVTYELRTTFPNYDSDVETGGVLADHFTITDVPEDSITINTSSIAVTVDGTPITKTTAEDGDYTLTTDVTNAGLVTGATTDGSGFTIVIDDDVVLANGGKNVVVSFTATVGNTPDVGTNSNDNGAKVSYSNNYYTGDGSITFTKDGDDETGEFTESDDPKTDTDYAVVFTAEYKVNKVDDGNNPLEDATFTLYQGAKAEVIGTDGKTPVSGATVVATPTATTPAGGTKANQFTFSGLASGTYTLVEKAPDGYIGSAPIEIVITADYDGIAAAPVYAGNFTMTQDSTAFTGSFDVVNTPTQTLPATGGIGTILFTVGGATIVLLAGAMFVLYMKKRKVE